MYQYNKMNASNMSIAEAMTILYCI